MKQKSGILILDFGSQYTQLIARRIRDMGVYSEIQPYFIDQALCTHLDIQGIILSGGPASTISSGSPSIPEWVLDYGVPILGICYGMQVLARQLGGEVTHAEVHEYGHAVLSVDTKGRLFDNLRAEKGSQRLDYSQALNKAGNSGAKNLDVWMSHGDQVTALPPNFMCTASTSSAPIAAMESTINPWFGVQFHPEVTHTQQGFELLRQFVLILCKATSEWTTGMVMEDLIIDIREKVGSDKVLLALSGGVDSSVVAALLHRAIGKQLICIFVDTGLMRLHEVDQVKAAFAPMGLQIEYVNAQAQFLTAIAGIACPEEKRKLIGKTFIEIFEQASKAYDGIQWLAQGTIYPDVIESAVSALGGTEVIKSHHNVGGLPEVLPFALLEPISTLFKDEVRRLGEALGLPHAMVYRHPFPGPGLAVRILGVVEPKFIEILALADAIFIEMLRTHEWYDKVSQAFAVFLPVKSVGVMGDGRRYEYVIALRAVVTDDFMTAHWARFPWDFLEKVSNRIINEVSGVSRVVYDISGKPPATIEWE